jgi:hypothetical protein
VLHTPLVSRVVIRSGYSAGCQNCRDTLALLNFEAHRDGSSA